MKKPLIVTAILLMATAAGAERITCQGNIVSTQGEGMVAKKHRFEVSDVTGKDVAEVLEKCKKIALERQNRAAKKSPAETFRKFSDLELQCKQGAEKLEVRRLLQTRP